MLDLSNLKVNAENQIESVNLPQMLPDSLHCVNLAFGQAGNTRRSSVGVVRGDNEVTNTRRCSNNTQTENEPRYFWRLSDGKSPTMPAPNVP